MATVAFIFIFHLVALFALFVFVCFVSLFWAIAALVRGFVRGIGRLFSSRPMAAAHLERQCTRMRCGAFNPLGAQYCRRCGSPLIPASRKAMDRPHFETVA